MCTAERADAINYVHKNCQLPLENGMGRDESGAFLGNAASLARLFQSRPEQLRGWPIQRLSFNKILSNFAERFRHGLAIFTRFPLLARLAAKFRLARCCELSSDLHEYRAGCGFTPADTNRGNDNSRTAGWRVGPSKPTADRFEGSLRN